MKFPLRIRCGLKNHISPQFLLKMKLTMILLIAVFLQVQADGYSQQINISQQNAKLEDVFIQIMEQTDYHFLYLSQTLKGSKPVNIELKDATLTEALNQCFTGQPLTYVLDNNTIIVKMIQPPPPPITGKVANSKGETLPGVSIAVKGTGKGTVTDANGNYSIEVTGTEKVLVFSYIGMKTQEILVDGRTIINIVLQENIAQLNEVVVTGFQTISKERATGSFGLVKQDKLNLTQLSSTNFTAGLEGLAAGVLVDKSGNIQIRGVSSIYSSKAALVVVDGFPIEGDLNTVNPKDIETITVLKDASAASIWGVRASNGVIVITTKTNKSDAEKVQFDFSSNITIGDEPNFGYFNRPTASEFINFEKETIAKGNGWFNPAQANRNGYSRVQELYLKKSTGELSDAQVIEGLDKLSKNNYLDQQDLFYRKSFKKQLNLLLTGGTRKNQYYASIGYTNNLATSIGNNDKTIIVNIKNTLKLLERLNLNMGVNTTLFDSDNNGLDVYSFTSGNPYDMTLDENGNPLPQYNYIAQRIKQGYYDKGYLNWDMNNLQELNNSDKNLQKRSSRLSVGLDYKIIDGLDISSKFLYEMGNGKDRNYQNMNMYYVRNMINSWTVFDPTKKVYVYKFPKGPILDLTKSSFDSWTFRNTLSYNKTLSEIHNINVVTGTEVRKILNLSNRERYYNYNDRALSVNNFDAFAMSQYNENYRGDYNSYSWNPNFSEKQDRFFSFFGNASYTYQGKYTLSGSARVDQANLFGTDPKYRYDPTWSTGFSWRASEERFIKDIKVIDHLLFRATYGINGNIGNSSPYPTASYGTNFNTQENSLSFSNPENQQLRKERTAVTNVGVDFSLFKSRLSGSIDVYNKLSTDLLGRVNLDPTTGFSSTLMNTAELSNKGVDINLNGHILEGDFVWDLTLNFGYNTSIVEKVQNPSNVATSYINGSTPIQGKPLDYLFSYRWAGLSDKGEPQVYDAKGNVVNWTTQMNDVNALKYVGSLTPRFYGGVITTLAFKNFSVTPIISYKLGHKMRLPRPEMALSGLNTDIDNRWKKPGDEAITDIPAVYSSSYMNSTWRNYYLYNDTWDEDASFVRLKSLTCSYDFTSLIKRNIFTKAHLVFQLNNLWLWTANDKGIDPEYYDMMSGKYTVMPAVKTYTIGLNLNF